MSERTDIPQEESDTQEQFLRNSQQYKNLKMMLFYPLAELDKPTNLP